MGIPLRQKKDKFLLPFLFLVVLLLLAASTPSYASNNSWNQSDWTGGADTGAIAIHPSDQTGWNKYYSNDLYINTTIPGEVTVSPASGSWSQKTERDFETGILTEVKTVGGVAPTTTRYEETAGVYTGLWFPYSHASASGGSWKAAGDIGGKVSFTFNGTGISWIGPMSWTFGIANVYLDNVLQGSVDLYCNPNTECPQVLHQRVLWSRSNLTYTTHTITIEVTGQRNPNAGNTWVGVDAFDVSVAPSTEAAYLALNNAVSWRQSSDKDFKLGTLTNIQAVGGLNPVITRTEETAGVYTGLWYLYSDASASGGSWKAAGNTGEKVSLTFNGTGISWIGPMSWTFGIANVYLDNVLQGSVDLYCNPNTECPQVLHQRVLWSRSYLTNTTHTITIEATGQRNPSAGNTWVGVDAFDVEVFPPTEEAYLMLNAGAVSGTFVSPSFTAGAAGASFLNINWTSTVPAGSTLRLQVATNKDNQTWNFSGPDGTANTYYDIPSAQIFSGHNGNLYFKYKVFFTPSPLGESPTLDDVTIDYINHGIYESESFDIGSRGGSFNTISWISTIPAGSALRFQIATNKNNLAWNFIGPDGTGNTYYETSGTSIFSGHNGDRYIKYKAFFTPASNGGSPQLDDVTIVYDIIPAVQTLTSSPYNTMDDTNSVNRWKWSEDLPAGSDIVLQIRTSLNGADWGSWYGPHATIFSASIGVSQITVGSTTGFTAGSQVTLTNSADVNQMEVKKIIAINPAASVITLDSATAFTYSVGSSFTDTYTDPYGTEPVNPVHRSGNDDRWIQYRVILLTNSGIVRPRFLKNKIGYFTALGVYQPDGIIDTNGDNVYSSFGAGSGGTSAKETFPAFFLPQPMPFDILIQNDGSSESIDDTFTLSWNTPSDISGNWTVFLNDGVNDLASPVTLNLNVQSQKNYSLKVLPSANAPADSIQDIILNARSENDYAKTDSVKASVTIKRVYQADGTIDGNGDNLYDTSRGGAGGVSVLKEAIPGDNVQYSVTLQNEGNIADIYTFSLVNPLPSGWIALINDGTKDNDITNTSLEWTTPSIKPVPYSDSTKTYTLKVIPKGAPATVDIILNIYSKNGIQNADSLTAKLKLKSAYKVDGIIYDFIGTGKGCGTAGAGDDVYGSIGSGNGGCTGVDIAAGSVRDVTIGIQNEGNIPDSYQLSWNKPVGWLVKMTETLNDGSTVEYPASPVTVPTAAPGNPSAYNGGEFPVFTFKVTAPQSFVSGSQTVLFDIRSIGNNAKFDSVKAVMNSGDTTPPSSVSLSTGSITATSVKVTWTAPGDDGTTGTATSYDLRYSTAPVTSDAQFALATKVRNCKVNESNLGKPKAVGGAESCTAFQLYANTDYYFILKTADEVGNTSLLSTCVNCPARTLTSSDTVRPGTITDLAVTDSTKDTMTLCWTATADDGSTLASGSLTGYELRYSTRQIAAPPGVGQVAFSSAVVVSPVDGFLMPKTSGMKECYIVPVENKIGTGGGIIDDRTPNTRFYFAMKALDEARNKSLLSNIAKGMTPLVANSYNMVSIPYAPNPKTPAAVFGDDVGAQLYAYWWDSRGPNFDSGCYDGEPNPYSNNPNHTCTKLTFVKEGLGYLLWAPQANIKLDVPSGSTQPATQNCNDDLGASFQCYILVLQEGWNMIGYPFDKAINFSKRDIGGNIERGIYVRRTSGNNVDVATFQDAATARNWIDGSIYIYNGVNYTFEVCNQDGSGNPPPPLGSGCPMVMQPWKAYWMRLHVAGNAIFELLIPN